jgi:adenylylsulfate kinase
MKILIVGLPGAGKTTLAEQLADALDYPHWNADKVRGLVDDWDFSEEGRERQLVRMIDLANKSLESNAGVICDFVAPFEEGRNRFNADLLIWMDTIKEGRYENTNLVFEPPINFDVRIKNFEYQIVNIVKIVEAKIYEKKAFSKSYHLANYC